MHNKIPTEKRNNDKIHQAINIYRQKTTTTTKRSAKTKQNSITSMCIVLCGRI